MLFDEFETKSYRIKQFFSSDGGISGVSYEFEGKENGWQIRLTDYQTPDTAGNCRFMLPNDDELQLYFYVIDKRQTPQPHLELNVCCEEPHWTQHQNQIELFFREFFVLLGKFAEDEVLKLIDVMRLNLSRLSRGVSSDV